MRSEVTSVSYSNPRAPAPLTRFREWGRTQSVYLWGRPVVCGTPDCEAYLTLDYSDLIEDLFHGERG